VIISFQHSSLVALIPASWLWNRQKSSFSILSSVYRGKKLIGHANAIPQGTILRKFLVYRGKQGRMTSDQLECKLSHCMMRNGIEQIMDHDNQLLNTKGFGNCPGGTKFCRFNQKI
jgi:hypothetical protein